MTTTIEDWRAWRNDDCTHLPAIVSRPCPNLPASWLPWWRDGVCSALLETGKAGRYTILVPRIDRLLVASENSAQLLALDSSSSPRLLQTFSGNPLETLRAFTAQNRSPKIPNLPFARALIGYFSYDLARLLEKLPATAADDLNLPLAAWGIADHFHVFDHQEKTLHSIANRKIPPHATDTTLSTLLTQTLATITPFPTTQYSKPSSPSPQSKIKNLKPKIPTLSQPEFEDRVRQIQNYIRSGDTYQVNLSIRETRPLHAAPEEIYEELRRINPSPYMALLRFPGFALVSGSPELLVRLRDGKIEARPIAGTRPRGATDSEDHLLHRELTANAKERAEHLMLVDLIRNDLGRVSAFGTVRVSEFMTVENYSHVMHIVSHIEGRPAPGKDLFDIIAATFPGGTITGAPKVRTMEIIEELEPTRRGPYTGSIGWIGFHGEMELNIAIRTLVAADGKAHVQAGAGIVIDSDPEKEYQESLNKAKALWLATEAAESKHSPVLP